MHSALYPLKFLPLFKNTLWGGNRLKDYGFRYDPLPRCGELWALSSMEGHESVIANGFLADNTLNEAIEIYMGDLVGDRVYNRFGSQFPLLVKLIDAAQDLSIQVHPDDNLARRRGMPWGKTEMWYILQADPGARLISGFRHDTSPEQYQASLDNGTLDNLLLAEQPEPGDVYFIPAGRIHALGKGLLVAEIQQASDCTYRIYDWNRLDTNGKPRKLHTDLAIDAIDFSAVQGHAHTHYHPLPNQPVTVAHCPYFTSRLIALDSPIRRNLENNDSFVLYLCVDGIAAVKALDTIVPLHTGECTLLPAVADHAELFCEGSARLLEITIDTDGWNDQPELPSISATIRTSSL